MSNEDQDINRDLFTGVDDEEVDFSGGSFLTPS